ncbi:hypothetical protein HZC07_05000, partial [Candidatus Micrarchaeota archaeon]|nr:hypothetical protein [Candidatus Micrarchaeota archaeon]
MGWKRKLFIIFLGLGLLGLLLSCAIAAIVINQFLPPDISNTINGWITQITNQKNNSNVTIADFDN